MGSSAVWMSLATWSVVVTVTAVVWTLIGFAVYLAVPL